MEIKYKNNLYDLDIDTLYDVNGHRMYDYGAPEFKVLSVVLKENITEITVLRTQELKHYDIYTNNDKCGIYNLKVVNKELLKLDNKYIDETINKGGLLETELTFKVLSEEYSNIEYVSEDKLENKDIESYISIEEASEGVVLLVRKI